MSRTCKNGVEWFVHDNNGHHVYVCDEHLIPAIKQYSGEVATRKVVGSTSCFWPTKEIERQSKRIATELEELGLGVIELAQELNNSLS